MALLNETITCDSSVYNIIKCLSNKFIKEGNICKYDKTWNKELISIAFDVLIYKDCINCDYSIEELKCALLFRGADYYRNVKTDDGDGKYNQLVALITSLDKFSSSNHIIHKILKFLYLLHIHNNSNEQVNSKNPILCSSVVFDEFKSNSNSKSYKNMRKVSVEKLNLSYSVKKEPLILNFDIEPNALMLSNLEKIDPHWKQWSYVSREVLRQDIKYALIGIQSSSFSINNSCIVMKDGLFTDGIDCRTLAKFLEPVIKSGNSFMELVNVCEDQNSLCSSAVIPSFKHFLDLYCILVDDFPKIHSLTSWRRYIASLHQMIETLKSLAFLVPHSKEFFEKVYYFTIKQYLPSDISFIVNTFLIVYSNLYFQVLDEWLFAGTCNSNLFIMKERNISVIDCKESWLKAFVFIKDKAPSFLPCLDIFECGKKVALLKLCSESDPFLLNLLSKDSKRPRIRLCKTIGDLQTLKENCIDYISFIKSLRCRKYEENLESDTENKERDEIVFENNEFKDKQLCIPQQEFSNNKCAKHLAENGSRTINDLQYKNDISLDELNQYYKNFREEFEERTKFFRLEESTFERNGEIKSVSNHSVVKTVLNFETNTEDKVHENSLPNGNELMDKSEFDKFLPPTSDLFDDTYLIDIEMQYLEQLPLKYKDNIRSDNIFLKENLKECIPLEIKDEFIEGFESDSFLIKEIIVKSVLIPLKMQGKLVNDALIHVFLFEKNFLSIAENLTNVFFLIDSNFSIPLVDNLSIAVENETPSCFLTYPRIKRLLESITSGLDRNLYFKINNIPEHFDSSDPDVFSCISLTYDIDWPLNFLITPKMIDKYNTIFQFLMSIERTSWKLKYLFRDLKNIEGDHFRAIQLHRFIMTQYINMLKSYVHNDVIIKNWNKFLSCISSIQDLNDLYKNHVEFIKKVRFMCFLGKATVKIQDELRRLFRVILVYCRIVSYGQWTVNDKLEFSHSKFSKLKHYFDSFMQLARYITAYLEKIVEHRYKSEFDGLLQLLTLNSYYQK